MGGTALQKIYEKLGEEGLRLARQQSLNASLSSVYWLIWLFIFAHSMTDFGLAAGIAWRLGDDDVLGVLKIVFVILLLLNVSLALLEGYSLYKQEKRTGTNRQSMTGWIWDRLKQRLLDTVVFGLFYWGVYLVFRSSSGVWFLEVAVLTALLVVVLYLLEYLKVRLGFKVEPLADEELQARLRRLFEKAGVPYGGLGVIKAGDKTARSNAMLVPRGGKMQVLLYDTLLDDLEPEEIEFTVAHELGHRIHKDIFWRLGFYGVSLLVGISLGRAVLVLTDGRWDLYGPSDVATLPLLFLVIGAVMLLLQPIANGFMRAREYAADRYALELTGNLRALEGTLVKLATRNFLDPEPPAWLEFWFHDHPAIAKRLWRAQRLAGAE